MEVQYHPEFEKQRRAYAFQFTCESCVHYDNRLRVCIHGFPNEMHRLERYLAEPTPATILFCKDFDLA